MLERQMYLTIGVSGDSIMFRRRSHYALAVNGDALIIPLVFVYALTVFRRVDKQFHFAVRQRLLGVSIHHGCDDVNRFAHFLFIRPFRGEGNLRMGGGRRFVHATHQIGIVVVFRLRHAGFHIEGVVTVKLIF